MSDIFGALCVIAGFFLGVLIAKGAVALAVIIVRGLLVIFSAPI